MEKIKNIVDMIKENGNNSEEDNNSKKRGFVDLTTDDEEKNNNNESIEEEESSNNKKCDSDCSSSIVNHEDTNSTANTSNGVVAHPDPLPDNNPKSFLSQLARCGSTNCVLYLCCIESSKDFIDGLKKCESSCGISGGGGVDQKQSFQRDGQQIHNACFQRDGSRHISLWQGKLSTKEAKAIFDRCNNKNISSVSTDIGSCSLTIPITHVQFTDGWNNWKAGNYLGLDKSTTTDPLRTLKSTILSGIVASTNMGKSNCDHLSLYRKRGRSGKHVTDAFARVRAALHDHHWGKLPVHSIRLKILGGEYDECKVLMSSSSS